MAEGTEGRPLEELRSSGLLWLINKVVFHPRGFALVLVVDGPDVDGREEVVGWDLDGDGSEPWHFELDEGALFAAAEATLRPGPIPGVPQGAESA